MNINKEFLIWIRFKVFYKLVKIYSRLFINQKIFKINKFSFNNVPEKDSISNFLLKFGMWESKERYLIKFMDKNIDTIEAGGGIGTMSIFLRDYIGSNSKLLILEPNPKLTKIIKKNFELNKFDDFEKNIIIQKALSHQEKGEVKFYEFDEPFENKLSLDSYEYTKQTNKFLSVETTNINGLLKEYDIDNFQLIIDVEGEELNIIKEQNQWLSKCKYIMFEAHHESKKFQSIINSLNDNNFELYKKNYNVYLFKNYSN